MHFAPWVNLTARLQRSEVKNEAQRGNIHNRRLDSSHKQKRASSTCNFIGADMELQSGVLFSPALTQCPHIPLCVCGWPLLTPPKEWPYWLQRVESRTNHQTQSDTVLFACCSSSPAVWALMWESYFDDFFFFFFTTDTITWKKATQRSQVFIPNTFETLCAEWILSGGEAMILLKLMLSTIR